MCSCMASLTALETHNAQQLVIYTTQLLHGASIGSAPHKETCPMAVRKKLEHAQLIMRQRAPHDVSVAVVLCVQMVLSGDEKANRSDEGEEMRRKKRRAKRMSWTRRIQRAADESERGHPHPSFNVVTSYHAPSKMRATRNRALLSQTRVPGVEITNAAHTSTSIASRRASTTIECREIKRKTKQDEHSDSEQTCGRTEEPKTQQDNSQTSVRTMTRMRRGRRRQLTLTWIRCPSLTSLQDRNEPLQVSTAAAVELKDEKGKEQHPADHLAETACECRYYNEWFGSQSEFVDHLKYDHSMSIPQYNRAKLAAAIAAQLRAADASVTLGRQSADTDRSSSVV